MFYIHPTEKASLPEVAKCHSACFPNSLSTKLGLAYVAKTLDWFLCNDQRFLFQINDGNRVVGYCGGFIPQKIGDGSSSGMLQHAFSEAINGIALKPWLLIHTEVVQQYSFLWRNIQRKITGNIKPAPTGQVIKPFKPYVGLVVIGVHPDYRGKGIAQQLLSEFEIRSKKLGQDHLVLSVKKDNLVAIKSYEKFGWHISETNKETFLMRKVLNT